MNAIGTANDKVALSAAYVAEDTYPADICVLRYALERNARAKPDDIFAAFEGGERWTFVETLQQVESIAGNLHELGVRQGDHVVLVLPTSPLALRAMFAINYLGAVYVPVNPALKGSLLEHVLQNAGAAFAIVHDSVLDRILAAAPPTLKTIVKSSGETAPAPPGRHHDPPCFHADQTLRATTAAAKADPAIRYAIDHLHVRNDGPVERRIVVLYAQLFILRSRRLE
jgi:acyl-CoA synthetase (AMP-forming)/AMP-acid ligase II